MPLLSFLNLSIGYENTVIIDNLSFEVEKGDYLVIIGENGAGKSTLLKTMLGLIPPIKGKIAFLEGLKKTEIGYLPQQTLAQRDFPASVYEVVLSGCLARNGLRPFYSKKDKELAKSNIEKMGLKGFEKRCYRELSGGQQQRVLLARALCSSNKILVLDEPVSGLDPKVTNQLYEEINNLNKEGITIVMISHDLSVLKYASKVLHFGHQTYFGDKESYFKSQNYQNLLAKGGE